MRRHPLLAPAAGLAVSGCTAVLASSLAPVTVATVNPRELGADEKRIIVESLSENVREPARYLWAPFPPTAPHNGLARYCASVNARSPHAPYNGHQPYIVQVQVSNGRIVSSVLASIAGGSDMRIVRNLCAKHGLNPDDAA